VIAVDTNILVHAHRKDSPWHDAARRRVAELADARGPLGSPLALCPRILRHRDPPTDLQTADAASRRTGAARRLVGVAGLDASRRDGRLLTLSAVLASARIAGPHVHDARVAALCLHHGVSTLWTADRDFSRFPELPATNPLIA
jgi:predicted nucleic acid-binding protein